MKFESTYKAHTGALYEQLDQYNTVLEEKEKTIQQMQKEINRLGRVIEDKNIAILGYEQFAQGIKDACVGLGEI